MSGLGILRIRSVMVRLMGIVAVAAIGLLGLAYAASEFARQEVLEATIAKTRNLAEAARDIAAEFDRRSQKGEFDQATAQTLARATIRGMRYGDGEYFFVYDEQGVNVVHGARPEREGNSFLASTDANGLAYIPKMIEMARGEGGHIFYFFPKAGGSVAQRKVSSVVGYHPWHWVVGTGLCLDVVDAAFFQALQRQMLLSLAILAAVMVLAWTIARSIGKPLRLLAQVTGRIGAGDYQVTVPATGRADEIGVLAQSIVTLRDEAAVAQGLRAEQERLKAEAELDRRHAMLMLADQFESSVKGVVETMATAVNGNDVAAGGMAHIADEARHDATSVAGAAEQVNANIQTVAAATEQLSASISEISSQVQHSALVADQAVNKASHTNERIQGLAEAASRIGEAVKLISDIASRTNLLALNATIEAARAGEAGKGFAVVAGEVKGLATQTARATGEIASQVQAVQVATQEAVEAIRVIASTIGSLSEVSSTIAAAVEEQSAATREISRNVNEAAGGAQDVSAFISKLADVTEQVGDNAAKVANSSQTLNSQTCALRQQVEGFLITVRAA